MPLSEKQMDHPKFWRIYWHVERALVGLAADLDIDMDDFAPDGFPSETFDRICAFYLRGVIAKEKDPSS